MLAASAVIVAVVVAVALTLGPGELAPATGAAEVIPSDTLLYVHLSTDRRRPALKRARSLAARFPDYSRLSGAVDARLSALLEAPASEVRPWLGNEAAFALLNTTTSTAGSLVVLDVARPVLARRFVIDGGALATGSYHGTQLLRNPTGTVLAFVSHYLVAGQGASVRAAIDVAGRREGSLAQSPAYLQAAADEPDDRVLDAYVSVAGVRRVLGARGGLLGALGMLMDQPALTGTAISLSATSPGARLKLHAALDPALARVSGPPAPFSPSLPAALPAPGVLMLDVQNLAQWAPRILGASAKLGIGGGVQPLFRRLGAALGSEGVDVHSLTAVFSGESAIAISPTTVPTSRAPSRPGTAGRSRRGPALVIVTRTHNQQATSSLLASLEAPLAQLFPPPASGPGQAPEFSEVPVAGGAVTVHRLVLAPGLELDYAVFRGLVVVATSLPAVGEITQPARSLDTERPYRATLGDGPDAVTSLLFLDFSQLLSLGEQTGLVHGRRFKAVLPDLNRIRSIGLSATREESDTNAELLVQIP